MPLPFLLDQKTYFYDHPWTKARDSRLCRSLLKFLGPVPGASDEQLETATWLCVADLRKYFNKKFRFNEVQHRIRFLRERYEAHTLIRNHPTTICEVETGLYYASDDVWNLLIQQNDVVKAYVNAVEPLYPVLRQLFRTEQPVVEEGREITFSEDSDEAEEGLSEEVDGPFYNAKRRHDEIDDGEAGPSRHPDIPTGRTPRRPKFGPTDSFTGSS